MLLADRFLHRERAWFDIATGERVSVVVHEAGPRRAQIAWAERCAMLAMLRHPLLLPLVDYGAAGPTTLFEAFGMRPPLAATGPSLSHLVTHGTRFLQAHGVMLSAAEAATLLRPLVVRPAAFRGRPVGSSLQPRTAWTVMAELLGSCRPRGSRTIRISAAPGMGLRTLRTIAARLARVEGYVAVCAEALWHWRDLRAAIAGRHVCLLLRNDGTAPHREAAAELLACASMKDAPPCLCLITERSAVPLPGTIHLDPMGMKAMASMIYLDPDYGPSEQQVFDAARCSEGAPGRFLERLSGIPPERCGGRGFVVHESPAPYGLPDAEPHDGGPPEEPPGASASSARAEAMRSRLGSVLCGAGRRAEALEMRGRHLAAGRLLVRAARVLQGRGESALAANCWLQLAWMARTRGALARAHEHASQAAAVATDAACQIRAGCLRSVCWTDAERFAEAQGRLDDLLTAALTLRDHSLIHQCRMALARLLLWTGQLDECVSTVASTTADPDDEIACGGKALVARARLAAGDLAGALAAARASLAHLGRAAPIRSVVTGHRVMAEALCDAGDLPQVRLHVDQGFEAAMAARLPLHTLRLRAVLLRALRTCGGDPTEARRIALGLERACRRTLPPLVERYIRQELNARGPARSATGRPLRPRRAAPFAHFLDLAHRAASDQDALGSVLAALCDHVDSSAAIVVANDRRSCAAAGKPWGEGSRVVEQALVSGQPVSFDPARQPPEAAEPVRCGGELLAVIACRWIAGAAGDPHDVAESLHAAALSMATHVRSVLEEAPAPPPSAWGDLLGDSAAAVSLRNDIQRAGRAPFPVLIEGESGSGKELVARAVHRLSARHARRFCAINCAALSDELLEAELFGHSRGAFTGALTERAGLFEEADGGTLFLDEVGELSARAQAKLLRVVQEGEVRRVGENLPRRVDVRIVAATNRPLEREASMGRFRTDLRFRLDVLRISVPPLRERVGDIALLAQHFWKQAAARVGSHATLGPDALAALSRYEWPGNVRELQNAIAWMAVHAPRRGRVNANLLPWQLATTALATGSSFDLAREEFERRYLRAALAQAGGQRVAAARALGVSRQGLAKMIRRLGIEEG